MRLTTGMMAGLGLMGAVLLPAQVSAEPKIYAYPSSANYCPAGLQPNTSTSYQQMMAHPAPKKHKVRHYTPRPVTYSCVPGEKGCR